MTQEHGTGPFTMTYWEMRNHIGETVDAARRERGLVAAETEMDIGENAEAGRMKADAVIKCAVLDAMITKLQDAYNLADALRITAGEPDTNPASA